jgi:hypothetical protein
VPEVIATGRLETAPVVRQTLFRNQRKETTPNGDRLDEIAKAGLGAGV